MCGIVGRFSPEGRLTPDSVSEVRAMTESLRHRGPDDQGLLDRAPLAILGHRRLSIIDVAQGQQPMTTEDGSLWITYNGEVYNFGELRTKLEAKGHVFRTKSDTEVVLRAYREWGERCCEHLEGMFAFGILDLSGRRLFLARDHIGKKPLYFRWRDGVLDFASELAALTLASDWRGELLPLAAAFFLRLGYVPSPWTIYRDVEKLRPGECCVIDARGLRRRRFWSIAGIEHDTSPRSEADVLEEIEAELRLAVRQRLVSEVPLGAFLSGGIDSGLVVSLMTKESGPGVKTTTIGFADDPAGDEVESAARIAAHNETDHEVFVVEADAAAILPKIMRHFGEPFADSSAIPTWYVARETRRRVTVALTGDGGDETWGGYDFRYVPHRRDARMRALLPWLLRRTLFPRLARLWPRWGALPRPLRLQTVFRNLSVEEDRAYYLDLCFLDPYVASQLAPDLGHEGEEVEEFVRGVYRSSMSEDPLESIMRADAQLYLPEDVLVKVDRMSMAHGLEVRSPFLAKRMVELALSLPSRFKVRDKTSKVALRALAGRFLPREVASLPKRGFHVPLDEWLRQGLRSSFEAEALNGRPAPWIDKTQLRRLWRDHQSGRHDFSFALWATWWLSLWGDDAVARGVRA
jgi:asparagine synthase (glutamine-hydrolysing)